MTQPTNNVDVRLPTSDDRLAALATHVAELTTAVKQQQQHQADERERLWELVAELNVLSRPAMDLAMTHFAELDEKGYFSFARESAGVLDHVVTSFSAQDVRALGDNVVTILQTVREMTQPEVMALVRRTAETAQGADEEFTTPPSTFALLRRMRDPEVRRGLARVLSMLETVGAQPSAGATPSKH